MSFIGLADERVMAETWLALPSPPEPLNFEPWNLELGTWNLGTFELEL